MQSKRHGSGTFKFADGRKYIGEWANGKMNGKGLLYLTNLDVQY